MLSGTAGVWVAGAIIAASLVLMLWRVRGVAEAWWVGGGAVLLVALRLLPVGAAARAVAEGADVYLFLTGMMLLSELAREHGVFDWVAAWAVRASGGSDARLFLLVYAAGAVITTLMSNDATAVVLTPAVLAAVRPSGGEKKVAPEPYLFACAMVANAASFVLPISNPANLVIYGAGGMPSLGRWLVMFGLPSVASIVVTYGVLRVVFRGALKGRSALPGQVRPLSRTGRETLGGIAVISVVLLVASSLRWKLGLPTCVTALAIVMWVSWRAGHAEKRTATRLREVFAGVSWSVLPLVAGLFCFVAAADRFGLGRAAEHVLREATQWSTGAGVFGLGAAVAVADNLANNLPVGLVVGHAVQQAGTHGALARSMLLAVDLGPNLSVTGSLATLLWLQRIRREGVAVSAGRFLLVGMAAMPLALGAALAVALWVR